jgi:choline-sulfatase
MRTTRPNLLIIMTDQQTHDLMSCAGRHWGVSTPHLDRLAQGGTRFTRAYCSDPVCIPSRFSLFTGRMPSAIGMSGNGGRDLHPFSPEHDADGLGHALRRAGYRTRYGGKVHWPIGLTPERLGFDYVQRDERERLAVEAADFILRAEDDPWAMVVSLINPHDICLHAIRAFAQEQDGFDAKLIAGNRIECQQLDEALRPPPGADIDTWVEQLCPPLPANLEPQRDEPELVGWVLGRRPFRARARASWGERDWRLHRWAYARLMERVDREIGVVLAALDASGQAEDTLVIFTSDHGDHGGSHRLEHKTFFYDEAARIPWIMRWPGRVAAGAVDDQRVIAAGLDLMATCCDAAGVELPAACRGRSALESGPGRVQAYGENSISRMLVTRDWKYVRYSRGANAEQLYDLRRDPGETRNHLSDHPAIAADLRQRLEDETRTHTALALGPMVEQEIRE